LTAVSIIARKRDGHTLPAGDIEAFVAGQADEIREGAFSESCFPRSLDAG